MAWQGVRIREISQDVHLILRLAQTLFPTWPLGNNTDCMDSRHQFASRKLWSYACGLGTSMAVT